MRYLNETMKDRMEVSAELLEHFSLEAFYVEANKSFY